MTTQFSALSDAGARQNTDQVAVARGNATVRMDMLELLAGLLTALMVDSTTLDGDGVNSNLAVNVGGVVAALDALTGNDRIDANAALRNLRSAVDAAVGNTDWRTGGGGGASSFADLTGMIADNQVPAAFTRDPELAAYAALAGATYTGVVLLHGTPTADNEAATKLYVDTVAAGMTPTPVSHNRYGALKATNNFVASDFTGANGFTSDTDTLAVPAFTNSRYLAFAIRNDIADPTDIREEGSAFNSIGLFTKQGTLITISGEMYNVWISNAALLPNSAENWVIA